MPVKKRCDESFWTAIGSLVRESEIVIDRPKGSRHPRYPELVYPVDYGYLKKYNCEWTVAASMSGAALTLLGKLTQSSVPSTCIKKIPKSKSSSGAVPRKRH